MLVADVDAVASQKALLGIFFVLSLWSEFKSASQTSGKIIHPSIHLAPLIRGRVVEAAAQTFLWQAQKSSYKTPLGFRSGGQSFPTTPLQGSLLLPTWPLKSPRRTREAPEEALSKPPLRSPKRVNTLNCCLVHRHRQQSGFAPPPRSVPSATTKNSLHPTALTPMQVVSPQEGGSPSPLWAEPV